MKRLPLAAVTSNHPTMSKLNASLVEEVMATKGIQRQAEDQFHDRKAFQWLIGAEKEKWYVKMTAKTREYLSENTNVCCFFFLN